MTKIGNCTLVLAAVLMLVATATAQDTGSRETGKAAGPAVTISITDRGVRFAALGSLGKMRLEVFNADGASIYNSDFVAGSVRDWTPDDKDGQRLLDGAYLCVVTIRDLSGKLMTRQGTIQLKGGQPSLQMTEVESANIGEQNRSLAPVADRTNTAVTLVANDGENGQIVNSKGALTFRFGDFFGGKDKERMRLTEDGKLGIGISEPMAKLDVAGAIRAERFLVSKPSTRELGGLQEADSSGSIQPLVAGTGNTDRVAKWTDDLGTLGNSAITETDGNVGIGTTTPASKLVVSANSATLPPASGVARFADADGVQTAVFADSFGTNPIFNVRRANGTAASPSALLANHLIGVIGASGFGASTYTGTRARVAFWASENWTDTANGSYVTFNTTANGSVTPGGAERLRIDNAGRVGIGTPNPGSLLDVAGDINVTGNAVVAGNIAAKYQDVAEWVQARKPIAANTVVTLDPTMTNAVMASGRAYDERVAGVVSERPGVILGERGEGKVLVATTGRVKVRVDASRHPIKIGDLMVTSDTPGMAMKSQPIRVGSKLIHRPGTIIGKALEPLSSGRGTILVLLSLH